MLAYATRRPLGQRQIGQLRHLADQLRARILLLPLVAGPADLVTRPGGAGPRRPRRRRASSRRARWSFPCRCRPRADPAAELRARAVVAAAYGATHLLADPGGAGSAGELVRSFWC